MALASMGIYVFNRELHFERLRSDATNAASQHDFGRNIVPGMICKGRVLAYPFRDSQTGNSAYWRDVGTLDAYWQANLELLAELPAIDLHDPEWAVWTHQPQCPPARFVGEGLALRSIVSGGCSIGGRVHRSVLSANCQVAAGSNIDESILLPNVRIGRGCRIRRAIIDSGCDIPDGTVIDDNVLRASGTFEVSPNGVTLVTADGFAQTAPQEAAPIAKATRTDPTYGPQPNSFTRQQLTEPTFRHFR